MNILRKLTCAFKGHDYSPKVVLSLPYVECTLDTCDRCGAGEDDLAFSRNLAIPYARRAGQ